LTTAGDISHFLAEGFSRRSDTHSEYMSEF